eukprot:scaffold4219_cov142-Skeletonema_menzelii.AAC.1
MLAQDEVPTADPAAPAAEAAEDSKKDKEVSPPTSEELTTVDDNVDTSNNSYAASEGATSIGNIENEAPSESSSNSISAINNNRRKSSSTPPSEAQLALANPPLSKG